MSRYNVSAFLFFVFGETLISFTGFVAAFFYSLNNVWLMNSYTFYTYKKNYKKQIKTKIDLSEDTNMLQEFYTLLDFKFNLVMTYMIKKISVFFKNHLNYH